MAACVFALLPFLLPLVSFGFSVAFSAVCGTLLVGCQRSRLKVLHKFLVCYLGSFDVFDALSQHSVPELFFDYKFIRDGTGLLRNGAIKPFRLTSEVLHQNFFTKVNSLPLLLLLCPAF